MQMHTIVKLLGGGCSQISGGYIPPGFGTPSGYATAMTDSETFDIDHLIKEFNA